MQAFMKVKCMDLLTAMQPPHVSNDRWIILVPCCWDSPSGIRQWVCYHSRYLKTCKRHGSKSYFGSQSKCVICVAWYIHGYRRGIKTKPHLLLHIFHDTSLADPAWKPLPLRGRGFHAGRLVKYHGKYATAMWFCFKLRWPLDSGRGK